MLTTGISNMSFIFTVLWTYFED